MDIALEIVDTFVGDSLYAKLHPAPRYAFDSYDLHGNGTGDAFSTWQYHPATHVLYLEPSQAAYESAWDRDNILRQTISLFFITWIFGFLNYFIFATLSYVFIFDKKTFDHPKFLNNQIWLEIKQAVIAMPGMAIPTTATFLLEVRGFTKLYDPEPIAEWSWYEWTQPFFFIMFTDFMIYWIHRWLHHPMIYKRLHKPHHKWIMPSPYAAYAFHPLDGFAQSVPYHVYPIFFPMNKLIFVGAFLFVNLWAILIHDGEYVTDNPVINGSACHTAHHLYFNYNFGQFTTLWDRLGGSYRKPDSDWFDKQKKMSQATWQSGIDEMEKIQKTVEGDDDRLYSAVAKKNI